MQCYRSTLHAAVTNVSVRKNVQSVDLGCVSNVSCCPFCLQQGLNFSLRIPAATPAETKPAPWTPVVTIKPTEPIQTTPAVTPKPTEPIWTAPGIAFANLYPMFLATSVL